MHDLHSSSSYLRVLPCCCVVLNHIQRLDEAEESYVKALQLDPNYKDAEEELFRIRLERLSVSLSTHTHIRARATLVQCELTVLVYYTAGYGI